MSGLYFRCGSGGKEVISGLSKGTYTFEVGSTANNPSGSVPQAAYTLNFNLPVASDVTKASAVVTKSGNSAGNFTITSQSASILDGNLSVSCRIAKNDSNGGGIVTMTVRITLA